MRTIGSDEEVKVLVIVLTSNYDAGILQMAVQMKKEFEKMFGEAILFAPDQAKLSNWDGIVTYQRRNSLLPFTKIYSSISIRINRYNPSFVYVCDSNLITARIVMGLSKDIPVYMTVHDVDVHPSYNSFFSTVKDKLKKPYLNRALKIADRIVLMSKHSFEDYKVKNQQYAYKLSLIRLGAHIPDVLAEQPQEVMGEDDYILFFGRLDKYKGIINLLKAYEISKERNTRKIVIAGRGTLTVEEQAIIDSYPGSILLIKRYISDNEMIWLFQHANCTVLPYIEASQSGVLSMSYYFGKPVIVSDLDGLTEFVKDGQTGAVFHSIEELAEDIVRMPEFSSTMTKGIKSYYKANLDWTNNIKTFLKSAKRN